MSNTFFFFLHPSFSHFPCFPGLSHKSLLVTAQEGWEFTPGPSSWRRQPRPPHTWPQTAPATQPAPNRPSPSFRARTWWSPSRLEAAMAAESEPWLCPAIRPTETRKWTCTKTLTTSRSQTIAVTGRRGRSSVPTECSQGVSCKKRKIKNSRYTQKHFLRKHSLLQRPSGKHLGHAASCAERARTGHTLSGHAQKVMDSLLMDVKLKNRGWRMWPENTSRGDTQTSSWRRTSVFLHADNLTRSKQELGDESGRDGTQNKGTTNTSLCGLWRACMDFEASGIGLQTLFGLKCLRSELVFIIMYLHLCVFCFFCFCSIDFFSDRSLPVQTLDCRNLKFEKF